MFGFLFNNNRSNCGCGERFDEGCGCRRKVCYVPKVCCEKKCKKVYEIKEHCICRDECKVDYQSVNCGGFDGKNCGCGSNGFGSNGFGGDGWKFDENLQYAGCGCVKKPSCNCGFAKEKDCGGEYFVGGGEFDGFNGFGGFGNCGGCKKCGCREW
jgi:hypothetical protein